MRHIINSTCEQVLSGKKIDRQQAESLLEIREDISWLLAAADTIRRHYNKNAKQARLCAIVNAKSGNCPEDCAFCSQSSHNKANIKKHPLLETKKIVSAGKTASKAGASCFSIVTSGKAITNPLEISSLAEAIAKLKSFAPHMQTSVSIGDIDSGALNELIAAGLDKVHHNLETAESFFPTICSTHTYADKVRRIRKLQEENVEVCCGGILGMGENSGHRLELAFALRELGITSIPLNFLNPIPGTPLQGMQRLNPLEALKIIAIFRFILPRAEIKICGGREINLNSLQPLVFMAGADGFMIGNYLTTKGNAPILDLAMLRDLGLEASLKEKTEKTI